MAIYLVDKTILLNLGLKKDTNYNLILKGH